MSTLGRTLRQAREEKGLTLENVAEKTNINRRYLEALESGRFDLLPGGPFIRGFLRAYVQLVHLNYDEVISLYLDETAPKPPLEETPAPPPEPAPPTAAPPRGMPRRALLAVGIVIILGLGAVAGWRLGLDLAARQFFQLGSVPAPEPRRPVSPQAPEPTLQRLGPALPGQEPSLWPQAPSAQERSTSDHLSGAPAGAGASGNAGQMPGAAAALAAPRGASRPGPSPRFTLRVRSARTNWMRLSIDGRVSEDITMTPGEEYRWQAAESFLLTIGNARAAEVYLNNVRLMLPVTQDNVLRDFHVDAGSLRQHRQ
ncbi:MAG: helix-turn-helix domain-containing protein [Candidatus Tectomicrobia bacterium]|nr:helix-turn-helix domain-containing protein [Candidatus Tectomicrobia bacterium]